MATGPKNAKTQSVTARIPHEVIEAMETLKQDKESTGAFIVAAMQGEITRRQLKESEDDKLLTSLAEAVAALESIEAIGKQAGENLQTIIEIAKREVERRRASKS